MNRSSFFTEANCGKLKRLTNGTIYLDFNDKSFQWGKNMEIASILNTDEKSHIQAKIDFQNTNTNSNSLPPDYAAQNPYYPLIPRKLMEGICGVSAQTLIRYEEDGLIKPVRTKQGRMELVSYTIEDMRAVLKKRAKSFKKKDSAEVISIFSQKGGVGKSAFTQHLGAMMSLFGKVLVIDLDSQADATGLFGLLDAKLKDVVDPDDEFDPTIMELMDWTLEEGAPELDEPIAHLKFEQVVKKISPNLHVIPADMDMSEINYSLLMFPLQVKHDVDGNPRVPPQLYMIKDVIDKVRDQYDWIIFDCPPNIETCNVSALFASNRVLIPLEIEAKCLRTMKRNSVFLKRLSSFNSGFNFEKVLIVPNKFKPDNIKMKAMTRVREIYSDHPTLTLSEAIFPNQNVIDKCSAAREPVFLAASRKDSRSNTEPAREFADMFWIVIHELLDLQTDHLIFGKTEHAED